MPKTTNPGLAAGLFVALVGTVAAQTGQAISSGGGEAPGPDLDMAVSGAQVLSEELGGGPKDRNGELWLSRRLMASIITEPTWLL